MIPWRLVLMILFSVGTSAFAQVTLRYGMSQGFVQDMLFRGTPLDIALAIARNPFVVIGLLFYGGSAIVWLFVLAKLDVSIAYAFVALGFLLTMAMGCLLLREPFSAQKLVGTAAIMAGIWLVAASSP